MWRHYLFLGAIVIMCLPAWAQDTDNGSDEERRGRRFDRTRFFERLDTNKDGKITLEELPERVRDRFKPLFERLGKDAITQDDFAQLRRRGRSNRSDGGRGFGGGLFFRTVDTNKDGQISKEELAQAAKKFEELDQNKDGQLDRQEFFGRPSGDRFPGNRGRGPDASEIAERIIEQADANNDGKISEEEAPERLKRRFSAFDANGDGAIERDEIIQRIRGFRNRRNQQD